MVGLCVSVGLFDGTPLDIDREKHVNNIRNSSVRIYYSSWNKTRVWIFFHCVDVRIKFEKEGEVLVELKYVNMSTCLCVYS